MPSFDQYFRQNMTDIGLQTPEQLFSTATTALATLGTINAAVERFGTNVTIGELVGAGTLSDAFVALGAVSAAYYAGAVVGSVAVATAKCVADGISPDALPPDLPNNPTDPLGNPQPGADQGGGSNGEGGDGGGGGGGGCVATNSALPGGLLAGDITVGAVMQLADEKTLRPGTGVVSYSQRKSAAGLRITTRSGVTLVCSDTAPIPTPDGLVLAPDLLGKSVPVRIDAKGVSESRWEPVTAVDALGPITVQHITVGDKCFWAGEKPGAYILHHNLKDADPGGGGGDDDPPFIDDNFAVAMAAQTAPNSATSHATTATHATARALTPAPLSPDQSGSVHDASTHSTDATALIHAMASFSARSEAGVVLTKHTQLDQVPLASHPSR